MLYSIFLYQSSSGRLMYDKDFQEISSAKIEQFGSFFSTLKSFISELVIEGSKELKNMELGEHAISITTIKEINTDLVIIADKEDNKVVNKLIPKIIKILMKHEQLLIEWDGDQNEFSPLNQQISELILSKTKFSKKDNSLIRNPEQVLKSIWVHKSRIIGERTAQDKDDLIEEKNKLITNISNTTNLISKLAIAEKIVELSEKLKDEIVFIQYQKEIKTLKDEIKDTKFKSNHYLNKVKTSLSEALSNLGNKPLQMGEFRDVYLNLFSFSTKLRNLTFGKDWEHYRNLAQILISKDETSDHDLNDTISSILKMRDNIEDYLN
ncbi:MAG: hypothetical protein ACTSRI_01260 [Promethearchaeota archaeon]